MYVGAAFPGTQDVLGCAVAPEAYMRFLFFSLCTSEVKFVIVAPYSEESDTVVLKGTANGV